MIKAHKVTSQAQFLLRRELVVEGLTAIQLDELIEARGGHLKGGWWERQKIARYRFSDDNIRANANLEPFCCSKIPPMKK